MPEVVPSDRGTATYQKAVFLQVAWDERDFAPPKIYSQERSWKGRSWKILRVQWIKFPPTKW